MSLKLYFIVCFKGKMIFQRADVLWYNLVKKWTRKTMSSKKLELMNSDSYWPWLRMNSIKALFGLRYFQFQRIGLFFLTRAFLYWSSANYQKVSQINMDMSNRSSEHENTSCLSDEIHLDETKSSLADHAGCINMKQTDEDIILTLEKSFSSKVILFFHRQTCLERGKIMFQISNTHDNRADVKLLEF